MGQSTSSVSLLAEVRACRICAADLPVPPRPVLQFHPDAPILIASQAPGRIVHETGIPFNDRSGDRLRSWLGVDRDRFYDERCFAIVPMGFCFPGTGKGGDLPPRPECAEAWRARLMDELRSPQLVLAVGRYAIDWHLREQSPRKRSLSEIVKDWRACPPGVLPTPHPSPRNTNWLKQNAWFERELVPELRARVSRLLGPRPRD